MQWTKDKKKQFFASECLCSTCTDADGLGKVITFSANVSRALGTLSAGLVKAGGFSGVFTKALGLITSPAAIVVGAIAAITAVIIHLWNTNEDFRNTITAIWQKIKDAFTTFAAGISERLSALGNYIQ